MFGSPYRCQELFVVQVNQWLLTVGEILFLAFLKIFLLSFLVRFYSIVAPGDTVNVIGEFDDQGKCDVDRDNNFIIVHPDVLVSGTRVRITCLMNIVLFLCGNMCCGYPTGGFYKAFLQAYLLTRFELIFPSFLPYNKICFFRLLVVSVALGEQFWMRG